MVSKVTSKYQVTIPREIRRHLKIHLASTIDWRIERGRVIVEPAEMPFLKWKGAFLVSPGDIRQDIKKAREWRAIRHARPAD
jgi:AbrB family looped-hinge helix DNA binding protein